MKELYEGHYKNVIKAQKKATNAASKKRKEERERYYDNPNKCLECEYELEFKKKNNKFCSSSCSAKRNNRLRGERNLETKEKISKKLKGRKLSKEHKRKVSKHLKKYNKNRNFELIKKIDAYEKMPNKCKVCGSKIEYKKRHRKTCSEKCRIIASTKRTYRNGSRKTIEYNGIILESSWELKLAKWLDEKKIKWIRPKPIEWSDGQKTRMYYPDFYLPKQNLYLDPKNPYCMELDAEKVKVVRKKINIIYGDINEVINKIASVV